MAKIQLTLAQDDNGSDAAMATTIALLTEIGVAPIGKVVLTIECENEDVESYADDVSMALAARPVGITATIKTTTERDIDRKRLASVTPMDKAWSN